MLCIVFARGTDLVIVVLRNPLDSQLLSRLIDSLKRPTALSRSATKSDQIIHRHECIKVEATWPLLNRPILVPFIIANISTSEDYVINLNAELSFVLLKIISFPSLF